MLLGRRRECDVLDRLLAARAVGIESTYWIEPGIPHDGYLADFLMRTKAIIRD